MKKIINGKLYNTETAKLVGWQGNGYNYGDFQYLREELYLKKTGEWFLFGEGGAMSGYAEPCGNGWSGGSEIIPFTEKEAKRWAVKYLDADEYMKLFGEVEE